MVSTQELRDLTAPTLASAGLELWDVEITRDILRVLVEQPGGVDLETLTTASGLISRLLDEHPEAAPKGRYQLEVSSPGLERTLRTPEQFRRYVGELVSVKTEFPVEGARRHRGVLAEVSEASITVEPEDAPGSRVEISYKDISRARTVLVWGPSAPPGRQGGGTGRSHRPGKGLQATDHSPKDPGS